ncbi:hypothetical protein [Streptomyces sp. NPDC020747]|uniref:hypothetical protein n=1 Tax=Streptomyces sp. NPDC020747 TaxID=3365086 RepID=UPI0037B7239B
MRDSKVAKVGASALAAAAASLTFAAPAQAAYPTSNYQVAAPSVYGDYAGGTITWFNRSVGLQGYVVTSKFIEEVWVDHTTVYFEVYDGNGVKMNSTTRTASGQDNSAQLSYNFSIGDPNGLKAVARVRITVCAIGTDGLQDCSDPTNYSRVYA